jgi:hypothetical protein
LDATSGAIFEKLVEGLADDLKLALDRGLPQHTV